MADSLVRELSALFRDRRAVFDSRVEWVSRLVRTWYVNSEGTAFYRVLSRASLAAFGSTQATDGAPLESTYQVSGSGLNDLPGRDSLRAAMAALGDQLMRLRQTPVLGSYDGPVLFGRAAVADLVQLFLVPRLTASRLPVVDNPMFAQVMSQHGPTGSPAIGTRVLPRFLSVVDDPTLREWQGQYVGGFRVDDDGVPTHPTRVVDHGILSSLLTTRTPVRGALQGGGNNWEDQPIVSTLLVIVDSAVSDAALRRQLLALATARGLPYGIMIQDLGNAERMHFAQRGMGATPFGEAGPTVLAATRIYLDGHEEPVRDATIVGLSPGTLKDIVAASRPSGVVTEPISNFSPFFGGGAGMAFLIGYNPYESSYIVPSILIDDITIRPPAGDVPRLPVLPPPWDEPSR